MSKALISALALASLVAGCRGGGAREAGPVPTAPAPRPPASTVQATSATTTEPTPSTSTNASSPAIALCADQTTAITVASREGAAGTISTRWRVTNTTQNPCRSLGYPGMDFHTSSGWLNVQVHRGGFPKIDQPPTRVVLRPGQSLYFVSYWSDVPTNAGPCKQFDRVKVTLPDNSVSEELSSSGCLNPPSVYVGPVTVSASVASGN